MSRPGPTSEASDLAAARRLGVVSQADFELAFFARILAREPRYVDVLRCQAQLLSRKGLHSQAVDLDRRLAQLRPDDAVVRYNLACSLAVTGQLRPAVEQLRAACVLGYDDPAHLLSDPDLDALRSVPEYLALLRDYGWSEAEPAAES